MNRFRAMAAVMLLGLSQAACSLSTQGEQQALVDRATLTVQDMVTTTVSQDPHRLLQRARGVMICPRIFKAGFFFGGEGGNCVLLGRAGNGTWSYPAFYTIGSGSFGLQIGIEDNQLLILILTERGLNAVLDNQVKLGANASLAVATIGAGIQGSTTAAVGADIVAYAASRGLFGGVTLEGSVMSPQSGWDRTYYTQPVDARQLVMNMQGGNPGADPLRDVLTRYGSRSEPVAVPAPPPPGYSPAYPPPGSPPPPPYQGGPQYQGAPQYQGPPQQQPYNLNGAPPQPNQGYAPPPGQGYPPPGQSSYQGAPNPNYPPPPNNGDYQGSAPPAGSGDRGPIQQQPLSPPPQ